MLPWLSEHSSIVPTFIRNLVLDSPAFIAYAGVLFLVIYAVAGVIAIRSKPMSVSWLILGILLAARLDNAILHSVESIALTMYTPGVITAVVIVLPITTYLLIRLTREGFLRRGWIPGLLVAGVVAQSAAIAAMIIAS